MKEDRSPDDYDAYRQRIPAINADCEKQEDGDA
jgi:hypothetical protein